MIVANAGAAIATPFLSARIMHGGLHLSQLKIALIVICSISNVVFAFALFRWQEWAFYGFVVTAVIAFVINVSAGIGMGKSFVGICGLAILYWVLNMGGDDKAWNYLK